MKILFEDTKRYEINIQRSVFISYSTYVESREKAEEFIKNHFDKTATHNCWAYKIESLENYTDDREPSSTAGKPILNSIKSLSLDYAVCLVIRHFGGKKLGIRGLIDAYSSAAKGSLSQLPKLSSYFDVVVDLFYDKLAILDYFMLSKKAKVDKEKSEYTDRVRLFYTVPAEFKDEVVEKLNSLRLKYEIKEEYLK